MSKNLDRDYWHETLRDHYSKLIEFTEYGFAKMKECKEVLNDGIVEVKVNPKTCANSVHDVFEAFAKDYFNDVKDVIAGEIEGVFGIYFKDQCFIRFNKLNNDFSISNAKTKQRDRFTGQYPIDSFSNDVVYLNLGYRIDSFWNEIKGIHLVCWNDGFEWEIEIRDEVTTFGQTRLELLENTLENNENPNRITIKKSQETKTEEENNKKSG